MGVDAEEAVTERRVGRSGAAIADLYSRHVTRTVRLAFLLTGDRYLAEDLAREAFIRSFGRWRHLRHPEAFEAYLRRTTVNLARSHHRRRKVEERMLSMEAPRISATDADSGALDERLRDRLLSLPPRQRAAVVLRFHEDLWEAQTAEILGCSVGNVKALTSRGISKLREAMHEHER